WSASRSRWRSCGHLLTLGRRLGLLLGRPADGAHDVLVAGAAAEVALDRIPDLGLGRIGVVIEQPAGGHEHARGAEPALQAMALHEALLERVELAARVQVLDGADGAGGGPGGQHAARA